VRIQPSKKRRDDIQVAEKSQLLSSWSKSLIRRFRSAAQAVTKGPKGPTLNSHVLPPQPGCPAGDPGP